MSNDTVNNYPFQRNPFPHSYWIEFLNENIEVMVNHSPNLVYKYYDILFFFFFSFHLLFYLIYLDKFCIYLFS